MSRKIFHMIPPKVDYALTDLGRSLCGPVIALGQWAEDNYDAIEAARLAFDARTMDEADAERLPFSDLRP